LFDLSTDQFELVRSLLDACKLHGHKAFAYALLEGRQTGHIYVDQIVNPSSAVICSDSGFLLAFGLPKQDEISTLVEHLRQGSYGEMKGTLFGMSSEWDNILLNAFTPKGAFPMRRLGFQYRPSVGRPPKDWREQIPEGYRLEPINEYWSEKILDGSGTGNFGIDPWFIKIAGGPKGYAAPGLGKALIYGDQIASLCGYCSLGHGEAELEVGTVPAFRGKGLAVIVSSAFLEQCQELGWLPAYTCDKENKPSIRVAHKLGYVEVEEILGFTF
jgi:GNAT superfamily N-acetyltransferase